MEQKEKIILVSCGYFEKEITDKITKDIERVYTREVFFHQCSLDISDFYNPGRRQYDANLILQTIKQKAPEGFSRIVGLLKVDLFIPILTYIFGQAYLKGNIAIASMYRLRNELYGLKADNDLLLERFSKVVIHELGHSFGLIHCLDPVCIMRSSTYVEDIDQKENRLCRNCQKLLSENSEH